MKINATIFPRNNQCVFIQGDQEISGQEWADECIALARHISKHDAVNWLLYQDDFYRYSQVFFALLLADKNIVLAQSDQKEKLQQAAEFADISIGEIQPSLNLPHFIADNNIFIKASNLTTLYINTKCTITLFTSGSSGDAKAIKKYWYQLANEIEVLEKLFPQEKACILATVTHKHIYGLLFKLLWPVFTNKKIICSTIEYPEQAEYFCQHEHNVFFVSSPTYLERTQKQLSVNATANIKQLYCSGGPLADSVADNYFNYIEGRKSKVPTITEVYGSTETGGIAWRQQVINKQWQLFPGHKIELAKDNTMLLRSAFLAHGELFKTDDQVKFNGRYFDLLGRVDRIVKLYEKRLSLDELEQVLSKLSMIKYCHCLLLDASRIENSKQLGAVVQLSNPSEYPKNSQQRKAIISTCKQMLLQTFEASLLPRKWRFVQQLPFNNQGKLVKTEIVQLFADKLS